MQQTSRHQSITIGLALLFGLLTVWGWTTVLRNDLLHQWRLLPPLPTTDAHLITIWETTVYTQAPDGQIFAITPDREEQWTPIDAIIPTDDEYSYRESFGPCDRADARFRWTARPPSDIRLCQEAVSRISVGVFTLSVISDADNHFWYFQTGGADFTFFNDLFTVSGAFLAGTLFAYSILRAVRG